MIIIEATPEHAASIASRMRQVDADEVLALSGMSPLEALESSMKFSTECWTLILDDLPACMFGYGSTSLVGGVSMPWLLTTDLVEKHPFVFLRASREVCTKFMAKFSHMQNYVDARHTKSIRWLKWLGFTVHEAESSILTGMPIHRFERTE